MLLWISIAGAALLLFWLAGRSYLRSSPAALAKGFRWTGAGIAGLLALLALVGGRVLVALGLALFAYALATRQIETVMRGIAQAFGLSLGPDTRPSGRPGPRVRTEWLDLELDRTNGEMRGQVIGGPYAGRGFRSLAVDELAKLQRAAITGDPQGAQILEAFLDRTTNGTWRTATGESGFSGGSAPLTRAEALRVLGLAEGASALDITEAHRRLMKAVHPDAGGSSVLAAQINAARAVLLGEA
ncbi:MAG: molecular chaperone DnaJ [Alphaproteobacteria bacterium]|nr:molecular chaperone DnaJ [Alphaproteobacteria bacterium]